MVVMTMMANIKRLPRWWLSMVLTVCLSAAATDRVEADNGQNAPRMGQAMGPDAAAAAVRRATGGQILRVEPNNQQNNPGYRVRVLLDDGRVRVLSVDAGSGRLSE